MLYTCPSCRQKNRLPDKLRIDGSYECGSCKQELFPSYTSKTSAASNDTQQPFQSTFTHSRRRLPYRLYGLAILVGALAVGFVAGRGFGQRHNVTPASQSTPQVSVSTSLPSHPTKQVVAASDPPTVSRAPVETTRTVVPTSPVQSEPPVIDPSPIVLPNGAVIKQAQTPGGMSKLTISNGNNRDAVVKLIAASLTRSNYHGLYREVYVKRNQDAVVQNIDPGTYRMKYSLGSKWDRQTESFQLNRANSSLETVLIFKETHDDQGLQYSDNQVTLYSTFDGNTQASGISDEDFDTD